MRVVGNCHICEVLRNILNCLTFRFVIKCQMLFILSFISFYFYFFLSEHH